MEQLICKVIVLEGNTDEAFITGYMNKIYGATYSEWKYNKPKFSKLLNIKETNQNILIMVAGSKDKLVPVTMTLLRDSLTGFLPKISSLIILRDYDNYNDEQIRESIITAIKARVEEGDLTYNEYGVVINDIQIYILPIGDLGLSHQISEWNHELEDYLIESIMNNREGDLNKIYEKVTICVVNKAHGFGFKTCCKSPLCVMMAFSENPSSLSGFYKQITGKNIEAISEVLENTGFTTIFNKFLE